MSWTREDWAAEVVRRGAERVASATQGERHRVVYSAAAECGHYVADEAISANRVTTELAAAAERAGLGDRASEVVRTITGAIAKGDRARAWYPQASASVAASVRWRGQVLRLDTRRPVLESIPLSAIVVPVAAPAEDVEITWYAGVRATRGDRSTWTWSDLAEAVATPMEWPGDRARLPLWGFAVVEDDDRSQREDGVDDAGNVRRRECGVDRVCALLVDYDDEPEATLDRVLEWWGDVRHVAHTTAHHDTPKGDKPAGPRCRVVVALSRPVTEDEYGLLATWALGSGRGAMGRAEMLNPRRMYFVPTAAPTGYGYHVHDIDHAIDVDRLLEQLAEVQREVSQELEERGPQPHVLEMLRMERPAKRDPYPVPTLRNIRTILEQDSRWSGVLLEDLLRDQITVKWRPLTDAIEADIVCWLDETYDLDVSVSLVHQAVQLVAGDHPYNPVADYLESLKWDGVSRLDEWLYTYAGVRQDPDEPTDELLTSAYGRCWMISAVARALEPGCQADHVLVLSGPKGLGKTSVFRILAGLDYHCESPLAIGTDEAPRKLAGVWIYELGELASVQRAQVEAVKQFVTTRIDRYRPPYGRNVVVRPRRSVFAGTTNELVFLGEEDRRWWVRRVTRQADLAGLAEVRDQLWAEAVHRYRAGESWRLDLTESTSQGDDADRYRTVDPWEGVTAEYIGGRQSVTTAEVLTRALGRQVADLTRADEMRVARILAGLGRVRVRRAVAGGRRTYSWESP